MNTKYLRTISTDIETITLTGQARVIGNNEITIHSTRVSEESGNDLPDELLDHLKSGFNSRVKGKFPERISFQELEKRIFNKVKNSYLRSKRPATIGAEFTFTFQILVSYGTEGMDATQFRTIFEFELTPELIEFAESKEDEIG